MEDNNYEHETTNFTNEDPIEVEIQHQEKKSNSKIHRIKERIKTFFANPKKRLMFICGVGLVSIALFGVGIYSMTREQPTVSKEEPTVAKEEEETPKPTLYPAPLDGILTSQEAANRHPLAVIVENHPDARPQAGLDKASIVYEAIAEGGITRFMALFGTEEAEKIGPVRSARTYFVDWARGYDAYLSHVGGNIDALDQIVSEKVLDLDQFKYSGAYSRERNKNVATEHTMFTSTQKLRDQAATNKYPAANNFNTLKFRDDLSETEKAALPASQKITIDFSSSQYNTYFVYDRTTNSYKRFMAGSEHTDQISKNQINPTNLIVMTVKRQPTVTRINEPGWNMETVGSGTAKIFLDGKTITGTWKKLSKTDREIFYDEAGNEVVFNRGKFWISVIPPESTIKVE